MRHSKLDKHVALVGPCCRVVRIEVDRRVQGAGGFLQSVESDKGIALAAPRGCVLRVQFNGALEGLQCILMPVQPQKGRSLAPKGDCVPRIEGIEVNSLVEGMKSLFMLLVLEKPPALQKHFPKSVLAHVVLRCARHAVCLPGRSTIHLEPRANSREIARGASREA